jgi:hypothetical protein
MGDHRESVPLYRRGQWTDAPSPLPAQWEKPRQDQNQALRAAGYALEPTQFGEVDPQSGQPALEVLARKDVPAGGERSDDAQYLIIVTIGGASRMVLAYDVVDAMDLVRQWVPAVQGWLVLDMLHQIDGPGSSLAYSQGDLVSWIAARASHGAGQADAWRLPG